MPRPVGYAMVALADLGEDVPTKEQTRVAMYMYEHIMRKNCRLRGWWHISDCFSFPPNTDEFPILRANGKLRIYSFERL